MSTEQATNAPSGAPEATPRQAVTMPIGRIVRSLTRPAVTLIFAAVIAQSVIEGIELPQWFLYMAGVVILEWWGERAITRLQGKE
jgi:hypothetical protein